MQSFGKEHPLRHNVLEDRHSEYEIMDEHHYASIAVL